MDPSNPGLWSTIVGLIGPVGAVAVLGGAAVTWLCWNREKAYSSERKEWMKRIDDWIKQSRTDRKEQFGEVRSNTDKIQEIEGMLTRALKDQARKRARR